MSLISNQNTWFSASEWPKSTSTALPSGTDPHNGWTSTAIYAVSASLHDLAATIDGALSFSGPTASIQPSGGLQIMNKQSGSVVGGMIKSNGWNSGPYLNFYAGAGTDEESYGFRILSQSSGDVYSYFNCSGSNGSIFFRVANVTKAQINSAGVFTISGNLTVSGTGSSIAMPAWVTPTLLNSWVNFDAGENELAGYYRDAYGIVHLRGFVKNGSIGNNIFELPAGYRPLYNATFAVVSNGAFGSCAITSGGGVLPVVGSTTWFALSGITFRAEQ